jgi:isoquinoline 1-oxidoreductase alpha subunit
MSIKFELNGSRTELEQPPQTVLLWVLRGHRELTGTKFGCGSGLCGACTVHLDGQPMRACITPISAVAGKSVTTIEGLSKDQSHPLQKAWIKHKVRSSRIMSL